MEIYKLLWKDILSRISSTLKRIKKAKVSYLFIAPFCLIFILFYLIPVVVSIGLSFTYYNILETPRFIGWQNYINLFFADDVFLTA
ncbi:MAG: sugar ABC transporter permease, partial [Lachnospiraceae bacterium]|nr:sugar ABC transporter permease [Lachnospiraceae bacterium]